MNGDVLSDPVVQIPLRAAAALLFLSAATHKLRHRAEFRAALEAYDLLPAGAVAPVAAALALAESAVGVACMVPASSSMACLVGASLLVAYSAAIALNLGRGRRLIDCGCGGAGGSRPLSAGLLARNAALAGLLLLASTPAASGRPLVWFDALSTGCLLALLVLLHAAFDVALANSARLRAAVEVPR